VKRGNFIKELVNAGCYLKRHCKKHDIYANPNNNRQAPVPRHPEIKESLCKLINLSFAHGNFNKNNLYLGQKWLHLSS